MSFLLVILVATRFMKQDDVKESEKPKEGFFSGAPTRAAECKCLPGYVPSNMSNSYEIVLTQDGWGWIIVGSKYYNFWWNMHGIPFDWNNTKFKWVTYDYLKGYTRSGNATKDIVQNALAYQKEGAKQMETYVCKSLSNISDTKPCY